VTASPEGIARDCMAVAQRAGGRASGLIVLRCLGGVADSGRLDPSGVKVAMTQLLSPSVDPPTARPHDGRTDGAPHHPRRTTHGARRPASPRVGDRRSVTAVSRPPDGRVIGGSVVEAHPDGGTHGRSYDTTLGGPASPPQAV
jgi:hypothetical protein